MLNVNIKCNFSDSHHAVMLNVNIKCNFSDSHHAVSITHCVLVTSWQVVIIPWSIPIDSWSTCVFVRRACEEGVRGGWRGGRVRRTCVRSERYGGLPSLRRARRHRPRGMDHCTNECVDGVGDSIHCRDLHTATTANATATATATATSATATRLQTTHTAHATSHLTTHNTAHNTTHNTLSLRPIAV